MKTEEKIILNLMELQRQRTGLIKMINARRNQANAFIGRLIGYSSFAKKKEIKEKWQVIKKIFKAITNTTEPPAGYEEAFKIAAPIIIEAEQFFQNISVHRANIEKAMIKEVKKLPVCNWWIAEPGRGELGLAIIIGEAGDLAGYENPAKLWKRFGLAVIDHVRQGGLPKTASNEQWIEHGYCRRRRASIWTIGDSLIKTNGAGGKYKKIYDQRKIYEKEKFLKEHLAAGKKEETFKPGHAHNCAKRYMEKRLLRDLWNQWK